MTINISHISKTFKSPQAGARSIFRDFSLTVHDNEFITIIGPNGSGKSTLLNLISGIDIPDSGTITLQNDLDRKNRIGYVWQDYRSSLLPWLNVYKNIGFPLRLRHIKKKERRELIDDLLNEFQFSINPKNKVYKLSGGQQQLICLLRSIASSPDILLCDEPFSALDQSSRWTMAFYMEQLWLKRPIPVLFVSHDIDESILLGSRIILLNNKGIIEEIIENKLPRPRNIKMLNSPEHIGYRKKVIEFMKENGALKDKI